ncbi:MAG TPA: [Fe-S]-binding protein [Anaerolineae bacterium]|nr:[Fe-S]-binding protein [Anaerolineae bacterium]
MTGTTTAPRPGPAERVLAGAVRRTKRLLLRFVMQPTLRLEDELARRPDVVHASPGAPRRIEIVAESMKVEGLHRPVPGFPRSMPYVLSCARDINASLREVKDGPAAGRVSMDDAARAGLEAFMRSLGIDAFGYTRVPPRLIFEGKAVLHANAIVLLMEMDRQRLDTAPSPDAAVMVLETYSQLGIAANRVARYLRRRGYSAQAGHPLGGLALYPPLAEAAGLGRQGMHGLLITPRFGPRVRLATVFTSIEDLPDTASDEHAWIDDFCRACAKCVRRCPPAAIRSEPLRFDSGRASCVDADRCLPYFVRHNGCSICVAVCPFHQRDYGWLHDRWTCHGRHTDALRADPPAGFPEHLRQPSARQAAAGEEGSSHGADIVR